MRHQASGKCSVGELARLPNEGTVSVQEKGSYQARAYPAKNCLSPIPSAVVVLLTIDRVEPEGSVQRPPLDGPGHLTIGG